MQAACTLHTMHKYWETKDSNLLKASMNRKVALDASFKAVSRMLLFLQIWGQTFSMSHLQQLTSFSPSSNWARILYRYVTVYRPIRQERLKQALSEVLRMPLDQSSKDAVILDSLKDSDGSSLPSESIAGSLGSLHGSFTRWILARPLMFALLCLNLRFTNKHMWVKWDQHLSL